MKIKNEVSFHNQLMITNSHIRGGIGIKDGCKCFMLSLKLMISNS